MRSYKKAYLDAVSDKIGSMMDYAVNDCELDGDRYLHMFISSGLARQLETGNCKAIAKKSGADLAAEAISHATGKPPTVIPAAPEKSTAEYWAGWALAHYQWRTARTFASIIRYLPYGEIAAMHDTLRDADITKFFETADNITASRCPQTKLKLMREAAGLSQEKLAREAKVPLKTIQMFEQREKDINRVQAATLAKIARALNCAMEDLMEQ